MSDNPYQLTFELKQHTPIIHFQHDQAGATLRATEVKPKLDRFILTKIGGGNYEDGKKIAKNDNLLVGKGEHPALDYRIRINANMSSRKEIKRKQRIPLFFGNMGEEYYKNPKSLNLADNVIIIIQSFNTFLLSRIEAEFPHFLAISNFGTRQTKGYGSFYIDENDPHDSIIRPEWFDYKIELENLELNQVLEHLELFYKSIRSGINTKKPVRNSNREIEVDENGIKIFEDVFYFKSLIFLYFKKRNIQWEKKTIKEQFFLHDKKDLHSDQLKYYGLTHQISNRKDEILTYVSNNKLLIKDLLGLSSTESWLSYDKATIEKKELSEEIERFKSPIQFKIIKRDKSYTIWIKADNSDAILNRTFSIQHKHNTFSLKTPTNFSIKDFFKFIINDFKIETHVEKEKFRNTDEYKKLKTVYQNLSYSI